MNLQEFSTALKEHNEKGGMYQIHLNTTSLEDSTHITSIDFYDLYFTNCRTLKTISDDILLMFENSNAKPVSQKEDGTNVYPKEINSGITIRVSEIQSIEEVENTEDWFTFPSERIFNLYMCPESKDNSGNRNVITVGFAE